jgi:hypothetical protein
MRGHKWKMLNAAMLNTEVTSRDFAEATGLPAPQTSPYAHLLVDEGYLRLLREVPPERGGRPQKFYAWTGKKPPRTAGTVFRAVHDHDTMWGKADAVIVNCFNAMVKCKEGAGDVSMECAV